MQPATDLARRLAAQAEAVCRRYLSNGHREGRYWLVGDVRNTPGRSMFVRLKGGETGKGAAGKWTDAATGEHGDHDPPLLATTIGQRIVFADVVQTGRIAAEQDQDCPGAREITALAAEILRIGA